MKTKIAYLFFATLSLANSTVSHAQFRLPPEQRRYNDNGFATLSIASGDGKASNDSGLQGQTFEVRIGKTVNGDSGLRLDFLYLNEGHPVENHRDGFAGQLAYRTAVAGPIYAEVSAGPYYSMNTTNVNGREINQKGLGILATVAVLAYIKQMGPGFFIKAQYNRVQVPEQVHTDAILIGIGKDFSTLAPDQQQFSDDDSDHGYQFSVITGLGKTTIHAITDKTYMNQLEVKKQVSPNVAYSVSLVTEGGDQLTQRTGVTAQAWYVSQISENWSTSAGAGPYVAADSQDDSDPKLNWIFSLQAERAIGKNWSTFFRFSRVAGSRLYDKDAVLIGISYRK